MAHKRLGHYELLERLGKGSFGRIYLARQTTMDRKVALKILNLKVAHKAENVESFLREARLAATLDHPNIVRVIDFGKKQGRYFFAMEFVDGIDLHRAVALNGPFDPRVALDHFIAMARALEHAHARGVIHHDVKPGNMLLREDGTLLLTDFGIARRIEAEVDPEDDPEDDPETADEAGEDDADRGPLRIPDPDAPTEALDLDDGPGGVAGPEAETVIKPGDANAYPDDPNAAPDPKRKPLPLADRKIMGSPAYMSPEVARGYPADARSDLYSLAASFFFVISGRAMYTGDGFEVLAKQVRAKVPSLQRHAPGCPVPLATLIQGLLAKDPDERTQTAAELVADLERLRDNWASANRPQTGRRSRRRSTARFRRKR